MFAIKPQQRPPAKLADLRSREAREKLDSGTHWCSLGEHAGVEVSLGYDRFTGSWHCRWLHPQAGVSNNAPLAASDDLGRNGISFGDARQRALSWTEIEMLKRPHLRKFR